MAQNALIKITIDPSKGVATINGVKVALKDLAKAQREVTDEIEKNNEAIEGSLKWHEMMIAKLKEERKAMSTNSDEFDEYTKQIKVHNLAIAEITQNKEHENAAIRGSFQWYEQEIAIRRRLQKTMIDNNAAVQAYEKDIIKLRAEQRALTTGTKLTGKGMQSMSSSAGLAGAAATEFGRAVGDAQYGIQGISNNVQQLSALFTDLVQQEGSTRKAFKLFTSTLMGPAGVLVAVSLVTTAIEFFVRRNKEAEDAVKDFNESVFLQTGALTVLAKKYKDQDTQDETRLQMLYQLALANEKVRNIIQDETLTLDQRLAKGEQYIDNQLALNAAREELAQVTSTLKGVEADAIPTTEEYLAAQQKLKDLAEETDSAMRSLGGVGYTVAEDNGKAAAQATVALYEAQERQAFLSNEIIGLQDILNDLTEDSSNKKEKEAAIIKNSIRDYEKRIETIKKEMENVDLSSEAYQNLEKQLNILNKTYEALLITQRQLDIEMAEAAIEAADVRIKAGMEAVKSEQQNYVKRKELGFREAELQLDEKDRGMAFLKWSVGFYERLKDNESFTTEERLKFREAYVTAVEALNKRLQANEEDAEKKAQDRFKANMKGLQEVSKTIGTINEFFDAEAQREIDRETNKTNAINDQLKRRLANEQMSAEERDKINQEIARNEAALVEKENAINEKRFKQQKAFNIAMAIIDTYVGANMALKDETIPNTFLRIAAMVSIIASGLANVATISRQKFVGKALPTPSLSAQGGGTAQAQEALPPEFNVVGRSGVNQLAETIQGQLNRPIKTYVVAGEVSTAQSLERNAVKEAGI